jgi:hypothetical protein
MALADPQSVKISGSTISLPRVATGDFASTYESADGLTKVSLSTVKTKSSRKRQTVRIDVTKVTPDPYIPTQNTEVSMSTQVVFDRPPAGYSNADAKAVWDGFIEALQASSSKIVTQLLGSES